MLESINEAVEVLTLFAGGQAAPLRFRWRSKVIRVAKITGQWIHHVGESHFYYYSILADSSDYFELCYDARSLKWILSKVWLAG